MNAATVQQRDYIALLETIQTATAAIAGQPDSDAVARWLQHRAQAYRRLANDHPRSEMAATAAASADLDTARARSGL